VLLCVDARSFECFFYFQSLGFHHRWVFALRHFNVSAQLSLPGRRAWDDEPIPRLQQPCLLWMRVKDADGVAGKLGQLHRAGLDLIYRAAWPVRSKHRRVPRSTALASAHSPLPQTVYLILARSESPTVQCARDHSPSKLRLIRPQLEPIVKIACTRDEAAMPETPHWKPAGPPARRPAPPPLRNVGFDGAPQQQSHQPGTIAIVMRWM